MFPVTPDFPVGALDSTWGFSQTLPLHCYTEGLYLTCSSHLRYATGCGVFYCRLVASAAPVLESKALVNLKLHFSQIWSFSCKANRKLFHIMELLTLGVGDRTGNPLWHVHWYRGQVRQVWEPPDHNQRWILVVSWIGEFNCFTRENDLDIMTAQRGQRKPAHTTFICTEAEVKWQPDICTRVHYECVCLIFHFERILDNILVSFC